MYKVKTINQESNDQKTEVYGVAGHEGHMPLMNQIRGGATTRNSMFLPLIKKAFIGHIGQTPRLVSL